MQLTNYSQGDPKVVGAPSFSPDGGFVVFNQYEKIGDEEYVQVKRVDMF